MRALAASRAAGRRPRSQPRPAPELATKTIPFDYVFEFELTGEPRRRVQDVVSISVEGVFVGVSIGYSLVPQEQLEPRSFEPDPQAGAPPEPVIATVVLPSPPPVPQATADSETPIAHLLVTANPGTEVALLDLSTAPAGEPPTATAGSDATVTFPIAEAPRILQIWDRSNGLLSQPLALASLTTSPVGGGLSWTPTFGPDPVSGELPVGGGEVVHVYGPPGALVQVSLDGELVNDAASDNDFWTLGTIEDFHGGITGRAAVPLGRALAAGDVLGAGLDGPGGLPLAASAYAIPRPRPSTITLGALEAGLEPLGLDLTRGFRLDPRAAGLFAADLPLDRLSDGALSGAFLTGCQAAGEASFLYSIDVVGTGRELQSQPVHNIAGLGIANGDRPFRPFARPIRFEPRSSIRFQIEELGGAAGTLYIVLQGYKILGTARIPA